MFSVSNPHRPWGVSALTACFVSLCLFLNATAGAVTITVNTTDDTLANDGFVSLREAIQAANTDAPAFDAPAGSGYDVIVISPALVSGGPATTVLTLGQLTINTEMSIIGPNETAFNNPYAISAISAGRVFSVNETSATISGITVRDGHISTFNILGGGIYQFQGRLTLADCVITSCATPNGYGGGLGNVGGTQLLIRSAVTNNFARNGGGLYANSGAITRMENSWFSDCEATEGGGAVRLSGGSTLQASDSIFYYCYAEWYGGALDNFSGGETTLTRCVLNVNYSGLVAGAFYSNAPLVLDACTFSANTSVLRGGAISHELAPALIKDCVFLFNSSFNDWGGAIYSVSSPVKIVNSTFCNNSSILNGGAIHHAGSDRLLLENCTITSNTVDSGNADVGDGGGVHSETGNVFIANTIIAGNADGSGQRPDISGVVQSLGYNLIGNIKQQTFASNTTGDRYGDPLNTTTPNSGALESPSPIDPLLAEVGNYGGWTWSCEPLPASPAIDNGNPLTTVTTDQRGAPRPFPANYDIGAVEVGGAVVNQCQTFSFDVLTPPGSPTGWSSFGFNSALGFADFSTTELAARLYVAPSPNRFRIAGIISNFSEWLLAVPSNQVVRGTYRVYAAGQPNPTDYNQIPNLRLRLSNRFAVNAMLEVFHHDTNEGDAAQRARLAELRPSQIAARPSVYRVDYDPIDVPYLAANSATEGVLRGAEAYAIHPTDTGYIALTEACTAVYPSSLIAPEYNLMMNYSTSLVDAGELRAFFPASELSLLSLAPGATEGEFATVDPLAPLPTYAESRSGITLASAAVPTNRIGVASREINIDGSATVSYATRPRVEPRKVYSIRWHLTSTQQVNRQAQIRLRARTIKFGWSQKLEIGGAWGTGGGGLYPLNANNSIAQQTLPGVGCLNPDKRKPGEPGGWYTLIMHSPMNADIRGEPPGTPVSAVMPNISAQPGNFINAPSRRDIFTGIDLVDTLSGGAGRFLEAGQVTADAIEIREHVLLTEYD
ncbi:MAG: CSLREA domain-containing protein [Candidatus Sumerlaeaceae bacterium]|nr:CSLREA domain-containing protein [Candidatus Sumerlaeaceae bacterium]